MGWKWDDQRETTLLWIIAALDDAGEPATSRTIRAWIDQHPDVALGNPPIDKLQAIAAQDASLDGLQVWILLGLEALQQEDPPLIKAISVPVAELEFPVRFDDIRLTADGRRVLAGLTQPPAPPVGFQPPA